MREQWLCSFISLLCLCSAHAAIVVKTNNYTLPPISDMPADFGPGLDGSLEAELVIADPEDGCQELAVPPIKDAWIALISRSRTSSSSTCTFDAKVTHAEAAGAAAVLVYDSAYEPLIIMAKPLGAPDPNIPAFFISQKSGVLLKRLIESDDTYALILPAKGGLWMSVLFGALAGLFCVTFVVVAFLYISHRQRLRRVPGGLGYSLVPEEGMTPAQLRALPVIIFERLASTQQATALSPRDEQGEEEKDDSDSSGSNAGVKGGGTRRTCAVCIEDYKDGEKLRVLPCAHRFHRECIDQWLSSRKPLCPICKWDAKEEFIVSAASEADVEAQVTIAVPAPVPTRRWRWNWGRSIVQHHSPPAVRAASLGRPSSSPVEAQPTSRSPFPANLFRSTPHNFPNMHAEPLVAAAEVSEQRSTSTGLRE